MNHKLEADGIMFEIGKRRILSNIYLKCETGKITGLLGRNGEGKTCLMNIIYGNLEVTSKSIRIDGKSLLKAYKQPGSLMYLPQFNFIPKKLTLKRIFNDFDLNSSEFFNWFPQFTPKHHSVLKNLSGGERRLIEVYVIIKARSMFAMLDEPFSYLMPLHIQTLKEVLLEEKQNKGLLITDHLYKHVTAIANDIYVLSNGKTQLINEITDLEKLGYANLA